MATNLLLPLALLLVGCSKSPGTSCTADLKPSLRVQVHHAESPVCGATVTATERGSGQVFTFDDPDQCLWIGPYEVEGTFDITASTASHSGSLTDVVVPADECHVQTQEVTVSID
jgi:hypothetical protein